MSYEISQADYKLQVEFIFRIFVVRDCTSFNNGSLQYTLIFAFTNIDISLCKSTFLHMRVFQGLQAW
jgi:hypothetical protein